MKKINEAHMHHLTGGINCFVAGATTLLLMSGHPLALMALGLLKSDIDRCFFAG